MCRSILFLFCLSLLVSAGCAHEKTQPAVSEKTETLHTVGHGKSELLQAAGHEPAQAVGNEQSRQVQVTGRVRLVGSGTLPEVVIQGEGKQWYIAGGGEDMQKLNALQQRIVTVEGEETIRELRWANGRSAGMRRYLSKISVIQVE